MTSSPSILVLNGPNLQLLGRRQPGIYGQETLADIEARCRRRAEACGLRLTFRQSNSEGELVSWIGAAPEAHDAIVINPAAYSHTSVALLDALMAVGLPTVEVHISNIHRRESFRGHSYVSKGAVGVICGLGPLGYELAIEALAERLLPTVDA